MDYEGCADKTGYEFELYGHLFVCTCVYIGLGRKHTSYCVSGRFFL